MISPLSLVAKYLGTNEVEDISTKVLERLGCVIASLVGIVASNCR